MHAAQSGAQQAADLPVREQLRNGAEIIHRAQDQAHRQKLPTYVFGPLKQVKTTVQ